MDANAIVLTPDQFEQMKAALKEEILAEIPSYERQTTKGVYSPKWIAIREQLEAKLCSDFNNGCGHWYQNQQGLYAAFRLAFQKERVHEFRFVDQEKLESFYIELIGLIEKYRGKEQ